MDDLLPHGFALHFPVRQVLVASPKQAQDQQDFLHLHRRLAFLRDPRLCEPSPTHFRNRGRSGLKRLKEEV